MKLSARNIAIVAGISTITAAAIVFTVNNKVLGMDKLLGKSGWF